MTLQPSWHCVANFGDVDPFNHGGQFLMIDKRGAYVPELWVYNEDVYTIHSIPLTQCFKIEGGGVSDNRQHPASSAWFGSTGSLESVASTVGINVDRFVDMLANIDPSQRARAYYDISSTQGIDNFDSYPWEYSKEAAFLVVEKLLGQIKEAEEWVDGF